MTVYQGSRYISAPVATPQRAAKSSPKIPAPVPTLFPKRPGRKNTSQTPQAFYTRQVIQGDRLDLLAGNLLGDARLWWMIADLNIEVFFPFDDLAPGSVIRIPASATASYGVVSQTFLPQVFARVFDGQGKPA